MCSVHRQEVDSPRGDSPSYVAATQLETGAAALSKQSAIEWMDVISDRAREAMESEQDTSDLEVMFALQLERLTPGTSHVGGRYGAIVQCPSCQRSACFIGNRRYAHGVRLLRHWTSTRDANGQPVQVLDVRPEWQSICVGNLDRAVSQNAELFPD
jgi:hypothetical protein